MPVALTPPTGEHPHRPHADDDGDRMTSDTAAVEFRNDDEGYRDWLRTHRGGWVINKGAPSFGLKLHRAICDTISKPGVPYTSRDLSKVCSTDRSALLAWALGVEWVRSAADVSTECPSCDP